MSSTQLFFQMHLPTYRRRCPLQEHVPPNESPVREAQESGPPRWRIFSRHHPSFPAKFCIAGQPRYRFCHDYSHSPFLHNLALFSLLLLQIGPCSTLLESSFSLENSPSNQSNAQFSADVSFFPISHHHHHSHFHLSKLLFPLVSSSFAVPLESFKSSTSQAEYSASVQTGTLNDTASTVPLRVVKRGEPGSKIGRKRKRELFALTISESEPLKTLRPSTFWTNTPPGSNARRRRLSSHSNALTSSGNILYGKSKSPYSALSPLSALTSSSAMAASANAANAAAGNMRMKILLNPPGFGGSLLPDQKCNFEIYPSGCFDENGSICDNPRSGLCVCRPGYSLRIASVYCLRPASIGEACYTTEQCERKVANSGCFNYREEYREENPSAFFGPSQTSWPMGECRCRIGHRFDELSKACVRSLIGSWCSNVWDCQMVEDDERNSEVESRPHSNHSRHSLPIQMLPWHSSSHVHGTKAKMANIVCESNICNCSQFFHYNTTAEECQFVETFGKSCRPNLETRSNPKRNLRSRASSSAGSSTYSISPRHHSSYRLRQLRSLPEPEADVLVSCNLPSTCSSNGTCVCAEGFEHQPTSTPQCQPTGHYTHLTGGSGRSGAKGDHNLGYSYYEGHSNVGNFIEYVLYILVPTLVLIFLVKPCFRRIGQWRTHIHHSDSDFYLGGNAPVMAECNVIVPGVEKVPALNSGGQFGSFPFGPHLSCASHNAYLFESTDGCYPYGAGCIPPPGPTADPSLALVREKLQTIEETQSEDGLARDEQCTACPPVAANGDAQCCTWGHNGLPVPVTAGGCAMPKDDDKSVKTVEQTEGIEMTQFKGEQFAKDTATKTCDEQREPDHLVKEMSVLL